MKKILIVSGMVASIALFSDWALAQAPDHERERMHGMGRGNHVHMGPGMHRQMDGAMHGRMGRGRMGMMGGSATPTE